MIIIDNAEKLIYN